MPIRLLSKEVSSMIAAGEVIERPASVVKELVENSLDAGSTEISVEVRGGGIEYIRVADNGAGIPYEEAELAFTRFATSKVSEANDLDAISTLGFRGEALPSIAAVSQLSVVTRDVEDDSGTRLDIVEGNLQSKERHGASPGTIITVQQLFRNVPARRKFLRSNATEIAHIQTLVTRYALAYPEVRFRLNTGGSSSFASLGSGDLREAIAAVYKLDAAQAMLEIAPSEFQQPAISGMVGPPSLDRANRSYMSFFVNRRWVQSRSLSFALEQSYHGFMKERRYPIGVINISLPYEDVDVNAHPSKTEVRFKRQDHVFSAIQQAVRQTLTAHSPVPDIRRVQTTQSGGGYVPRTSASAFWPVEPFAPSPTGNGQQMAPMWQGTLPGSQDDINAYEPAFVDGQTHKNALPMLRVLGQVQNTYLAAEGPDGMYLIDQHAAHERVMFEKIGADMAASTPHVQSLLEPATVELGPKQHEIVESQQELIASLGLLVEPFGGNIYLLRGVPSILSDTDPVQAFLDILDMMADGGGMDTWQESAVASMACHSAIRAGKVLTHEEMMELTRQLEQCQQPHTCPHGRPTIIHLSRGRLDHEFGR